jgi:hypothetical protein
VTSVVGASKSLVLTFHEGMKQQLGVLVPPGTALGFARCAAERGSPATATVWHPASTQETATEWW